MPQLHRFILVFIVLVIGLSGCGGGVPGTWYQAGSGQADFDRDFQDCRRVAESLARQASVSGRHRNPEVYQESLRACIQAKGWSQNPDLANHGDKAKPRGQMARNTQASQSGTNQKTQDIPKVETLTALGKTISLPFAFDLLQARASQGNNPSTLFVLSGPGPTTIHALFQEVSQQSFTPIDYPLTGKAMLYLKGWGSHSKEALRWSVFFDQEAVVLGAYLLWNEHQRTTMAISRDLPRPQGKPPPGLHLTKNQRDFVETFTQTWTGWVNSQIQGEPSLDFKLPFKWWYR